jgi:creatinine amidohydrolase
LACYELADLTWTAVAALDRTRTVAVLPVGAIEAHGPHLPLATDVIIAQGMAVEAARQLTGDGLDLLILPPVVYTPAHFAAGFPGTLGIRPLQLAGTLADLGECLVAHDLRFLALANAHFEPANVAVLRQAAEELGRRGLRVAFPDVTRRSLAVRLGGEFQSGACHAGRYEGSLLLALRPDLVDQAAALQLPENRVSLVEAIRAGLSTFEAAGGSAAYFGDPAAANAEEGMATLAVLGEMLAASIRGLFREVAGT